MSGARFELIRCADEVELAARAAAEWLRELNARARTQPRCAVALSGGRGAGQFFSAVRQHAARAGVSWSGVDFFWADERCVAPESAQSNFRVAREALLMPLGIAAERIHRIRGELGARLAAELAEVELRTARPAPPGEVPVLDWVFLGMGEDGHVASLFPHFVPPAPMAARAYLPVFDSPKPPAQRVTLSYAALAAARAVWVLVTGAGKAGALAASLGENGDTPLARVIRARALTRVFSTVPDR